MIICSKCNTENKDEVKFCRECGNSLCIPDTQENDLDEVCVAGEVTQAPEKKKKMKLPIKIGIWAVVFAILFFTYNNVIYVVGNALYKNHNYSAANVCYSIIVPVPVIDKKDLSKKAELAESMVKGEKEAAVAIAAAKAESGFFDVNKISAIYTARGTNVANLYGESTVLIVQKSGTTKYTYIVSKNKISMLSDYPEYYNKKNKLYIYGVGEANFTKGWLVNAWNIITDTYADKIAPQAQKLDKKNVLKIYKENK